MKIVSSSEFQKNFGAFKELAQREPITVTSNGRESVVLISAASYREFLKSGFAYGGETTEEFERDLKARMDKHSEVHDRLSR